MQKLNIVAIILAVVFLGLNVAQFFIWRGANEKTVEQFTGELAKLEHQIATYGDTVTIYTVSSAVKAGDEVTAENIIPATSYDSVTTNQYVYNIDDIVGRFFKIAVNPGTPLLSDMFMDEELDDTVRDRDLTLNYHTAGLEVGDYVDIRVTFPYGDDFIVIPHKRVYNITDNTLKLYLTEYEWNLYQGCFVDYCLNAQYGCVIYADRYIEPGLQQTAVNYYAVPSNIATLLQANPNIIDKVEAASLNQTRDALEQLLVLFRDSEDTVDADGSRFNSQRGTYTENVKESDNKIREERENAEEEEQVDNSDAVSDDFWAEDTNTETTEEGTSEEGGNE